MHQNSIDEQYNECGFCQDSRGGDILIMMTEAVYSKHAINQSQTYVSYIDTIMKLQQPMTRQEAIACCEHQEYLHLDERDEYLKRQYLPTQYDTKIKMLTQYYKFHSNIPRVIQPSIERILGKYHDKKREHDYKKIKRLLKEEQGISITSVQESESDFSDSAIVKKSRYSTLLNELDETTAKESGLSDSNLLKDMCKQIERVLPSRKKDSNFQIKGTFYQDNIFEKYLKHEQMKARQKLRLRNQQRKNSIANNLAKRINMDLIQTRKDKRQKQNPKHSRQLKRKDKSKMVYNTNINIQIKNAMFCTGKHLQNNIQSEFSRNNSRSKNKNSLFKKKLMDPSNFLDVRQPSSAFLHQIYKSSINDKKKSVTIHQQRTNTKESVNRSQSKEKKRSLSKYSSSQAQLKRGSLGSQSARRIVYNSNQLNHNSVSKVPSKALSANNLKTRIISNSGSAAASLSSSTKRRNVQSFEKRPIQMISNYGSSNLRDKPETKAKQNKISEMLSRKLTLKVS